MHTIFEAETCPQSLSSFIAEKSVSGVKQVLLLAWAILIVYSF